MPVTSKGFQGSFIFSRHVWQQRWKAKHYYIPCQQDFVAKNELCGQNENVSPRANFLKVDARNLPKILYGITSKML